MCNHNIRLFGQPGSVTSNTGPLKVFCSEGQGLSQNPRGFGDNIIHQYFLEKELPLEVMGNKHIQEIDMNDVDRRLVQG